MHCMLSLDIRTGCFIFHFATLSRLSPLAPLLLLPHSYFNNVACLPPGRACNNLSFEHDARTTHTHTYTNTHTVTHTRTPTEGEWEQCMCGPLAKAFNMQFMFATRSITGNSHMPSTQRNVWGVGRPRPPQSSCAGMRRVGAQIAVSGHGSAWSCGKSKSSSKTKLDYFMRSVGGERGRGGKGKVVAPLRSLRSEVFVPR